MPREIFGVAEPTDGFHDRILLEQGYDQMVWIIFAKLKDSHMNGQERRLVFVISIRTDDE